MLRGHTKPVRHQRAAISHEVTSKVLSPKGHLHRSPKEVRERGVTLWGKSFPGKGIREHRSSMMGVCEASVCLVHLNDCEEVSGAVGERA